MQWSTDAEDNNDKPAATLPHQISMENSNGLTSSSFRTSVNRISSDHLRAKGLQRLALQSGAAADGRFHRPGMAVRYCLRALDWLVDWLLSRLIALSPSIDWLIDWWIWFFGRFLVGLIDWLIDCGLWCTGGKITFVFLFHFFRSTSMGFSDSLSSGMSSTFAAASGVDFLPRNAQKTEKFEKLLSPDKASVDMEELRKLSWSGVPSNMRTRIWRMLTGYVPPICDPQKLQEYLQRKREEYRSLVSEYYPKREDDQWGFFFIFLHLLLSFLLIFSSLFSSNFLHFSVHSSYYFSEKDFKV